MFKPSRTKEEWSRKLIVPLYTEGYIETMWNARKSVHKEKGWILKSGLWSMWFFNMRPVGSSEELFHDICTAMAEMIIANHEVDMLIGVEMAGISLTGGVSRAMYDMGYPIKHGYTRPLPKKVRNPMKCLELIKEIDGQVADYSEKEYVEGRLELATNIAILDDIATDLGSKIIARQIVLWQAGLRKIKVNCSDLLYFLNRTKGNTHKGLDFATEKESAQCPEGLSVDYMVEISDCLGWLKKLMRPREYEVFMEYQNNPGQFQGDQGESNRREVIKMATLGV